MESSKRLAVPIMTHPGIQLGGRTVRQAVTEGEIHAEAIRLLAQRYPSSASTTIMDLTVEAEAFGAEVRFEEDDIPNVVGRLVHDSETVETLEIPSLERGRVPEFIKAHRLAAGSISCKPVFGGCIGPFSLAGRLFDMSEMMMSMYLDPGTVKSLVEKCTTFLTSYIKELKSTGIDGVVIAEPAAGLVSNEDCLEFSTTYIRRLVEAVQDESFIVVLHNCGNTGHCTAAMVESGAAALHFGNKVDILEALRDTPSDILVMGNLDPSGIFRMGSPDKVREETSMILQLTAPYRNFILSSGCDVPPETPLENIDAFYDALEQFNKQR